MRVSRLAIALAAVACAVALPASRRCTQGQARRTMVMARARIDNGSRRSPRRRPPARRPRASPSLTQHTGALSVALVVSQPDAGHVLRRRTCTPAPCARRRVPSRSTLPDIYADEHGVAKLVTTRADRRRRRLPGRRLLRRRARRPVASDAPVISCGDIKVEDAEGRLQGAPQGREPRARPRRAVPEGQRRLRLDQGQAA